MRTLKISFLAAGILLLAGCGQKVAENNGAKNLEVDNAPKVEEKSADDSVISSISDAIASGKTMKCNYSTKDKDGKESKTSVYLNGKKFKSEIVILGVIQHVVFDGEATYFWAEGQGQGMKMTAACAEDLAKNTPADQGKNQPELLPSGESYFDNATDVSCSPANNADFSIPDSVTFSDQCEMLKNLPKNLPSMPQGTPGSVPPSMPSNDRQL